MTWAMFCRDNAGSGAWVHGTFKHSMQPVARPHGPHLVSLLAFFIIADHGQ